MYRVRVDHMNIEQIADSGQVFRIRSVVPGTYSIPAICDDGPGSGELIVRQIVADELELSCSESDWNAVWSDYFDISTDYCEIERLIKTSGDSYLCDAFEYGKGIRILRQDLWETVVSFIVSQNNNISRIRTSLDKIVSLADLPGRRFPSANELSPEVFDDTSLGLGYRAEYLAEIYRFVAANPAWLDGLRKMSYADAYSELIARKGVGPKVANCICLFGLHHIGAFPIDTHIKQILQMHYPQGFSLERYADVAGIVQQYMFYYKLNN